MIRSFLFAVPILACLFVNGCALFRMSSDGGRLTEMKDEPTIRVALMTGVDAAPVSCSVPSIATSTSPGGFRLDIPADAGVEFRANVDGVEVWLEGAGRKAFDPGPVVLIPDKGGLITVDRNRYRGVLEVRLNARGSLTIINRVLMEDYLRGVVPNEIGHGDEALLEAVKAQAVAARTYAVAYRGRWSAEGYDLLNTVEDQVYTGAGSESKNADRAIRETRGVIGLHRGEAIMTNYSSTCGGHTASREEVWDKPPLPYLKGVSDEGGKGHFCSTSRYFNWEESWAGDEFWRIARDNLTREYSLSIPAEAVLKDLHVREKGPSGRVRVLEFETDRGTFRALGDRIRWVTQRPGSAGPLRSILFEPSVKKSKGRVSEVVFKGRGWGHGVGMCQWGAMERSRGGQSYDRILKHYYRGIRLVAVYE
jgi:stage II sporulation protein D